MGRRLILAMLATLMAAGSADAQNQGQKRGDEPKPPRAERRDERPRQPDAERRSRIDRAEQSIRERRGGRSASPSDDGDGMIYRRSNSYRRW